MRVLYSNRAPVDSGQWLNMQQLVRHLEPLVDELVLEPAARDRDRGKPARGPRLLQITSDNRAVWKALDRVRPEVVMVRPRNSLAGLYLPRLRGLPTLLEVHGHVFESSLGQGAMPRGAAVWSEVERQAYRMATRISVVSQPLKDYVVGRGIPAHKVTVVPNAVDTAVFDPTRVAAEAATLRRRLGLDGKLVVGFVGHFSVWHGLDFLLAAMEPVLAARPDVALLLIGRPKAGFALPPGLARAAVLPGIVPFEQVPAHLACMDVFVAPYPKLDLFHFSPLKLFEAMAMARPVLASDQGQISELLAGCGVLHAPDDADDFRAGLARLLDDAELRHSLGEAARRTMLEGYTWQHKARRVHALLRETLETRR